MPRRLYSQHAYSVIEYIVMLMILMGVIIVSKDYIQRSFSGRWKGTSDQYGYGRQFDPHDSIECDFDSVYTNNWYDKTCVENYNCPIGNKSCEDKAITSCQKKPSGSYCLPQAGDVDHVIPGVPKT